MTNLELEKIYYFNGIKPEDVTEVIGIDEDQYLRVKCKGHILRLMQSGVQYPTRLTQIVGKIEKDIVDLKINITDDVKNIVSNIKSKYNEVITDDIKESCSTIKKDIGDTADKLETSLKSFIHNITTVVDDVKDVVTDVEKADVAKTMEDVKETVKDVKQVVKKKKDLKDKE